MRRDAAYVCDVSHQSATRLIYSHETVSTFHTPPSFKVSVLSRGFPHSRAPSIFFAKRFLHLLQPISFTSMSPTGALGGAGAGVPSGSGGRKRGRPFGSRNRAKDPAATPPVPRRRGRLPGSRNKRTLVALAAAATAESAGAAPAATVAAAPALPPPPQPLRLPWVRPPPPASL
jgi:hypothetical protein